MQLPTHFLIGIVIQSIIIWIWPSGMIWVGWIVIAITAFLSHILLDCIAISTYHPPEAHWEDPFWKIFHLGVYITALALVIIFGRTYWWGMLWSFMIDLVDWIILRWLVHKEPLFHPIIDKIRTALFSWLPNLTIEKKAAFYEIGLIGIFILLIWVIPKP